jgi:hypothetical protein
MSRFCSTIFFTLMLLHALRGQDAAGILRRSVELDAEDNERLKDYTYLQVVDTTAWRGGKPTETDSETSEITMLAGRPYTRVISRNGKPLSPKDEQKERQKMDREFARRRNESPADKAKQEKERAADRKFLLQVPDAFTLRIEGVDEISGKPAWIIGAEPKPGFRPKGSDAALLKKVRGRLWIDQAEYQWVKADIETLDTLSMGFSLVRIARGMHLSFEQTRVNDEVWLPSLFSMRGDARVGLLLKMHGDVEITYRDYRKFQADSRVVTDEQP